MSALAQAAARLGFDPARLEFAARTALACCVAVLAAWLLGLEHPQWSGMTVWIASQPVRGHLLEKSLFRLAGTLSGTAVGVALVALFGGHVFLLVLGLALWIGLCAGIGNVQRGFVAYGTILAGYSAAMVALLGTEHQERIFALGADRLLTVLLGVAVALLAGWFFALRPADSMLERQTRQLCSRVLGHIAARLRGQPAPGAEVELALVADIAALDEQLDPHGAGSLRLRQSAHAVRTLLSSQVSALLWLKNAPAPAVDQDLARLLAQAAQALEAAAAEEDVRAVLARAAGASAGHPALQALIDRISATLHAQFDTAEASLKRPQPPHLVVLHRDWVGAREALLRSSSAMLVVGLLWWLTGWQAVFYMLLGTAVMTTLFSALENPARTMRWVIIGHLMGIAGALACRWLAWPLATSQAQLVFWMLPFILLGALVSSHRRTMAGSFDYNMVMLLLLQPSFPLGGTWPQSLGAAAAVLAAPLLAFAAYRLVYPTNALRRMDTLIGMMVRELQDMAASPDAARHQHIWRARLHHRLLKLVLWREKAGERSISPLEGSLAVLSLGGCILHAQALLRRPGLAPGLARRLHALLRRLNAVGRQPGRALQALQRTAAWVSRHAPEEAPVFEDAVRHLAANLRFFGRGAPGA